MIDFFSVNFHQFLQNTITILSRSHFTTLFPLFSTVYHFLEVDFSLFLRQGKILIKTSFENLNLMTS